MTNPNTDVVFTVGADDTQLQEVFKRLGQDMTTVGNIMAGKMRDALNSIPDDAAKAAARVNQAWVTLGSQSNAQLEQQKQKFKDAYDTIAKSGLASAEELKRAHKSMEEGLAGVSEESEGLHHVTEGLDEVLAHVGITGVSLGGIMKALTSPLALVSAGMVALTAGALSAVEAMTEIAKEQRVLSAIAGATVTETHATETAFKLAGLESDRFQLALFRMSQALDAGGVQLVKLGIGVRNEAGSMKEPLEAFLEVRDAIAEMGSASEKNTELMRLFGRAGRELAPIFALDREEFKKYIELAEERNPWSQANQDQVIEYVKNLNRLHVEWEALKVAVGQAIVGKVSFIVSFMGQIIGSVADAIRLMAELRKAAKEKFGGETFSEASAAAQGIHPTQPPSEWPASAATRTWRDDAEQAALAFKNMQKAIEESLHATKNLTLEDLQIRENARKADLEKVQQYVANQEQEIARQVAYAEITESQALSKKLQLLDREKAAVKAYWEGRTQDASRSMAQDPKMLQEAQAGEAAALAAMKAKWDQTFNAQIEANKRLAEEYVAIEKKKYDTVAAMGLSAAKVALENEIMLAEKGGSALIASAEQVKDLKEQLAATTYAIEVDRITKELALESTRFKTQAQLAQLQAAAEAALSTAKAKRAEDDFKTQKEWMDKLDAAAKAELDAMAKAEKDAQDADIATIRSTSQAKIALTQQAVDRINRMRADGLITEKQQYELTTVEYKKNLDERLKAAQDGEAGRLLIELDFNDRVVKLYQDLAAAQARVWDQVLQKAKATAQIAGDTFAFLDASFVEALTKGTDTFSSLSKVAQDSGTAIKTFFSDSVFNVLEGKLADFQTTLQNFRSAINRIFANFISDTVTNEIGQFFAQVTGLGNQASSALQQATQSAASDLKDRLGPAAVAAAQALLAVAQAQGTTSPEAAAAITQAQAGLATPGGSLGSVVGTANTLLNAGSKLQSLWNNLSNVATNFQNGGLSGVLVGTPGQAVQSNTVPMAFGSEMGPALEGTEIEASALAPTVMQGAPTSGLFGAGGTFGSGIGSASLSGFQIGMGWAAAALGTIMIALDQNKTDIGKAIQSATLVAGAALAGPTAGISLIVAPILNWLEDAFGLFTKASKNWLEFHTHLQGTLGGEQDALKGLQDTLVNVKSIDEIPGIIQTFKQKVQDAGVGGFADTKTGLFQVPGVPGATGTDHEGGITANFDDFTNELNRAINDALDQFVASAGKKLTTAGATVMSDSLLEGFKTGLLQKLSDEFDTLRHSTTATVDDLKAFEAKLTDVAKVLIQYGGLGNEIALLSGDMDTLLKGAINGTKALIQAADQQIKDAHDALIAAVDGPDVATAIQNLHDAIVGKYEMEKKLITDLEANIASLLQTAGSALMEAATDVTNIALARGDSGPLGALLDALNGIGQAAQSTAVRVWAASAALNAVISGISSAVSGGVVTNPGQIPQAVGQAAIGPLTNLYTAFNQQLGAGDISGALATLNQGADLIRQLANASIAGVQQWEQQIDATIQSQTQKEITAAQAAGDANIKQIQAAAKEHEKSNKAQIDALTTQQKAAQAVAQASQEWAGVVDSLTRYINQLKLGDQAPPDAMGQYNLANQLYQQAVAGFSAHPSAKGADAVQQAASDLLNAAQQIYARPSPAYAELFGQVTDELERVRDAAAAQVTPEEQTNELLDSIQARIDALNADTQTSNDLAQAQIDAQQQATQNIVNGLTEHANQMIAAAHEEAQATITGIGNTVSSVMTQIAGEQATLLGQLVSQQEQQLTALTNGKSSVDTIADLNRQEAQELSWLREDIESYFRTGTIPTHERGTAWTRQGLAYLHEGEAVLDAKNAADYRSGRLTGQAGGTPVVQFHVHGDLNGNDADRLFDAFEERLTEWVRNGRGRDLVQRVAVGSA